MLALIFLLNFPGKLTENVPALTQITWESVYQAIRILDDDDNFLELDNIEEQNPVYYYL